MYSKLDIKQLFFTIVFILGILFSLSHADDMYYRISSSFLTCDSILSGIAEKISTIRTLDTIDEILLETIHSYPEFEYLMRVNSKGKIISKVVGAKVLPRTYRYVGRQMWYKTVAMNKRPYYGSIINKKGYYLFWVRPILARTKYSVRFRGTLVAKINIGEGLERIAEQSRTKFQVKYWGKNVYSNIEESAPDTFTEKKLAVYGMKNLTLQNGKSVFSQDQVADLEAQKQVLEAKDSLAIQIENESQEAQKSLETARTRADIKKVPTKTQEKRIAQERVSESKKGKEKKSGYLGITTTILFILICIVLVAGCFYLMKMAADKNRKIIESIDKGEL